MAKKSERFRAAAERSGEKRIPKGGARRDAHAGHTLSKRSARKASYALEDTRARPSRKSTRRSANSQKPDSNLKRRQMRRVAAPKSRAIAARARG